jgi:hypothetical protein
MCDQRERLIDYVYDECSPQVRQEVEAHVAECVDCRDEVRGLRDTRQDLLAWDVPEHGSVWRAFAPPPQRPSWRDIPAWAMAAAASLMFLAGAAGGAVTRLWMLPAAAASPVAAVAPAPVLTLTPTAAVLSDVELARIEARVLDRVRMQMETGAVATRTAKPASLTDPTNLADRLAALEEFRDSQVNFNLLFGSDLDRVKNTTRNLRAGIDQAYERVSFGSFR